MIGMYMMRTGLVIHIKKDIGNYYINNIPEDSSLNKLSEEQKNEFITSLTNGFPVSDGSPHDSKEFEESTQTIEGTVTQNISSNGDIVYVSSDPSKILYFINYARLYVNLDDPGESFGFIILYIILIVFTTMFAIRYVKRVIYVAFLTLMAPLVALTYPIDKVKDR